MPRICPLPVSLTWPRYRIVRAGHRALRPYACGLYESEGYVPIGNFNGNPVATFFGEKRLAG
jgi:hypothetical protein